MRSVSEATLSEQERPVLDRFVSRLASDLADRVQAAALHEDRVAVPAHRVWQDLRQRMVLGGPIASDLATAIQRLQTTREQAGHDALNVSSEDAEHAVEVVDAFVDQVVPELAG